MAITKTDAVINRIANWLLKTFTSKEHQALIWYTYVHGSRNINKAIRVQKAQGVDKPFLPGEPVITPRNSKGHVRRIESPISNGPYIWVEVNKTSYPYYPDELERP